MPSDLTIDRNDSLIEVRDRRGVDLPFSKGLMATSILATGLETGRAHAIAADVERMLRNRQTREIGADALANLAMQALSAPLGGKPQSGTAPGAARSEPGARSSWRWAVRRAWGNPRSPLVWRCGWGSTRSAHRRGARSAAHRCAGHRIARTSRIDLREHRAQRRIRPVADELSAARLTAVCQPALR